MGEYDLNKNNEHLLEKTVRSISIYKGNIIDVNLLDVVLPNGNEAKREVVYHQGAVGIIAIYNDEMYFVKQYRISTEDILIEVPAGKIEPNDSAEKTARKELKEETGLVAESVSKIYEFYVSPGFSNEIIHLYEAKNITLDEQDLDLDEFVDIIKVPVNELQQKLRENYFKDAKTIAAVQYVISHY